MSEDALDIANESSIAAMESLQGLSPKAMHKRAALVVRCSDCAGRAVAWVLWVDGRPLLINARRRGRDGFGIRFLDEPIYGEWCGVRCQRQNHVLERAELFVSTPPAGAAARALTVAHG